MNIAQNVTPASLKLFLDLASDAGNWSGQPLFGGNVGNSPADKGNLTHLKKLGLVRTEEDDDDGNVWVIFTKAGREFARENGVNIRHYY